MGAGFSFCSDPAHHSRWEELKKGYLSFAAYVYGGEVYFAVLRLAIYSSVYPLVLGVLLCGRIDHHTRGLFLERLPS